MDFAGILSTTGYVIEVIIGVSLVIFVHELGHFLAAKWAGVKVRRFFFGFAPTIRIGKRKIKLQLLGIKYKGTLYGVGLLPFGGFVDMAGEQEGDEAEDTPPEQQFTTKTAGQRAVIFVAGAAMNAISAVLFFILAFFIGVSFVRPTVGGVAEGGPAWKAGLKPGDKILEIDGEKQEEFTELLMKIALADADQPLEMKIKRGEELFTTEVTPRPDPMGRGMTIGITTNFEPVLAVVEPNSPAAEAGLREGDRITQITYTDPESGKKTVKKIEAFYDITDVIREPEFIGEPVELRVQREGKPEPLSITIKPEIHKEAGKLIGITPRKTTVGAIKNDSAAGQYLKENDVIDSVKCNGGEFTLVEYMNEKPSCQEVTVGVNREFEEVSFEIDTETFDKWLEDEVALTFTVTRKDGEEYLLPILGTLQKDMPAVEAGMKPGDRIVKVDGVAVKSFSQLSSLIKDSGGKPLEITWERNIESGKTQTQSATLEPATQKLGWIGIVPTQDRFIKKVRNPFKAIAIGWDRTILWGKRVFLIIEGLFTSKVSARNLAGPVGIFQISYAVTRFGIGTLLYFLAMISINLAILNVFPVPVLDGGHLLFLGIEKIKGSPVSVKTQIVAQTIGLVLLLGMAIFVTINDISRLFTGF